MKRLEKSSTNIVVSGVLGGIGEYFDIDPVVVRVIFVFLTFLGMGWPVPLYIILAFLMPEGKRPGKPNKKQDWREAFRNQNDTYRKPPRKKAEKVEEDDWSDF